MSSKSQLRTKEFGYQIEYCSERENYAKNLCVHDVSFLKSSDRYWQRDGAVTGQSEYKYKKI